MSRQTAYRWLKRWRSEGEAGLEDRSSRPHRCPTRVSAETEQRIVADRVNEKEGPHLMAGRLGVARSTIYAVLRRRGLSRCVTWTGSPGSRSGMCGTVLVSWSMSTSRNWGRYPTGAAGGSLGGPTKTVPQKPGYEFAHSMVDDHTRVAYTEVLDAENGEACAGFMVRAAAWFATLGFPYRQVHDRQRVGISPLRRVPRRPR